MNHARRCAAGAALAACLSQAQAQTLPPPPVSPVPVVTYEYDAQGNPTKTVQAPGSLNLATQATYDTLNRAKDTTDAKAGKTRFGYDGADRPLSVTDPRSLVTQTPRNGLGDPTQLVSPDTGAASLTYDAAGNLKTRTDSRGVKASFYYDALNRLTSLTYSQTGQTSVSFVWAYDTVANGIGRVGSLAYPGGTWRYTYDAWGRVTSNTQQLAAATGANASQLWSTTSYAYDAAGHITAITYPSGRKLSITYTGGQPSALALAKDATSTPSPLISQIQWQPFGAARHWQWANGQSHDRIFDTSGRLVRYRLGSVIRDLTYDSADRISAYTHYTLSGQAQPQLDQRFNYDELGRLTQTTLYAGYWSFSYDANGNRTSATASGNTSGYTIQPTSNRIAGITNPTRSFSYDATGNTTADGQFSATYDLTGRMSTLTKAGVTTTYTYNNLGRRIRKFSSSGAASTVVFMYDLDGQLLGEYDQNGKALREYVWLGATPIAVFTPDPAAAANPPLVYYIHADHLDTPRVVLDKANNIRWRWLSEPFGVNAPESNPSNLGSFTFNLRFPGQYFDQESGLNYNYFRSYDSSIGRYTQSDPIGLAGGINTYAYVGGNPLSYMDAKGLYGCKWVGVALICDVGPPPVVNPDNPNGTSPSVSWPGLSNPFGGMFSTPRPKGMSPLEERQFDRYCADSGDPCQELKREARKAIAAATPKMNDMLNDATMFGTPGWDTHKANLMGRINQINAIISLGQRMGCDMSSEIALASALYVPNVPLHLKP